jgi:xanthine dehydrogenase YagS FAD-binding subunit
MDGGAITEARLALGGVAHKPWRDTAAEAMLTGQSATKENFQKVAESIVRDAKGFGNNTFKIELAKRAVVRALRQAAGMWKTS